MLDLKTLSKLRGIASKAEHPVKKDIETVQIKENTPEKAALPDGFILDEFGLPIRKRMEPYDENGMPTLYSLGIVLPE